MPLCTDSSSAHRVLALRLVDRCVISIYPTWSRVMHTRVYSCLFRGTEIRGDEHSPGPEERYAPASRSDGPPSPGSLPAARSLSRFSLSCSKTLSVSMSGSPEPLQAERISASVNRHRLVGPPAPIGAVSGQRNSTATDGSFGCRPTLRPRYVSDLFEVFFGRPGRPTLAQQGQSIHHLETQISGRRVPSRPAQEFRKASGARCGDQTTREIGT